MELLRRDAVAFEYLYVQVSKVFSVYHSISVKVHYDIWLFYVISLSRTE